MNRAIIVLAQINDMRVHTGKWVIEAYPQETVVEGTIQKKKCYYLTFYRLATGLPGNIWNYAYEHGISLEPSAVIKTSADEFLYCYRLD